MSNYSQTTFFAPKDSLLTGNPLKLIKGADVDPEFAAIAVAIATKFDATNISSAPVGFADGTFGAPSITFAANTNTGIYRIGVSTIGISTNATLNTTFGPTGVQVGAPTGGDKGAGTLNATGLFINGVALNAGTVGANPTALVGIAAINGTATTFIRSDGAPAINQAMAPTWTGNHIFSPAAGVAIVINSPGAGYGITVLSLAGNTSQLSVAANGGVAGVNSVDLVQDGTNIAYLYNRSNTALNIGTNNATRISIAAGGAVTINAPASGIALSATGISGGTVFQATTVGAGTVLNAIGPAASQLNLFNMAQSGQTSWTLYQAASTNDLLFFNNALNNTIFSLGGAATPLIRGWGPVAAGLVDMTPDTGTFTGTWTGIQGSPTGTVTWRRNGKVVTLSFPTISAAGTSTATTMTMTGLPAALQPATLTQNQPCWTKDNAVIATSNAQVTAGSGTITFGYDTLSGGYGGTTGLKGMPVCTITYLLD